MESEAGIRAGEEVSEQNGFEGWAILEVMGHRRLGGYVSEQEVAGSAMLRIDIYKLERGKPEATQLYSSQAIYAITPTTERMARVVGERCFVRPVERWGLPSPEQPEKTTDAHVEYDQEYDDEEFDESPY